MKELEKAFAVSMKKERCPTSSAVFAASTKGRSHLRHMAGSPVCLAGTVLADKHREMSHSLCKRQVGAMNESALEIGGEGKSARNMLITLSATDSFFPGGLSEKTDQM